MSGLKPSCRIKVNARGDWRILPPAGQITQIGTAGTTGRGLVANDDLFVSGKLEVDGVLYGDNGIVVRAGSDFYGSLTMRWRENRIEDQNENDSKLAHSKRQEEKTIPVGQGAAGINTAGNLVDDNCVIIAVAVRVTQAPGGGAATFSLGRTGGNIDEFIQDLAVAMGTTGTSPANGDGVNVGPVHNAATNTLVITTDANVTGSDMKILIVTWLRSVYPPPW